MQYGLRRPGERGAIAVIAIFAVLFLAAALAAVTAVGVLTVKAQRARAVADRLATECAWTMMSQPRAAGADGWTLPTATDVAEVASATDTGDFSFNCAPVEPPDGFSGGTLGGSAVQGSVLPGTMINAINVNALSFQSQALYQEAVLTEDEVSDLRPRQVLLLDFSDSMNSPITATPQLNSQCPGMPAQPRAFHVLQCWVREVMERDWPVDWGVVYFASQVIGTIGISSSADDEALLEASRNQIVADVNGRDPANVPYAIRRFTSVTTGLNAARQLLQTPDPISGHNYPDRVRKIFLVTEGRPEPPPPTTRAQEYSNAIAAARTIRNSQSFGGARFGIDIETVEVRFRNTFDTSAATDLLIPISNADAPDGNVGACGQRLSGGPPQPLPNCYYWLSDDLDRFFQLLDQSDPDVFCAVDAHSIPPTGLTPPMAPADDADPNRRMFVYLKRTDTGEEQVIQRVNSRAQLARQSPPSLRYYYETTNGRSQLLFNQFTCAQIDPDRNLGNYFIYGGPIPSAWPPGALGNNNITSQIRVRFGRVTPGLCAQGESDEDCEDRRRNAIWAN